MIGPMAPDMTKIKANAIGVTRPIMAMPATAASPNSAALKMPSRATDWKEPMIQIMNPEAMVKRVAVEKVEMRRATAARTQALPKWARTPYWRRMVGPCLATSA